MRSKSNPPTRPLIFIVAAMAMLIVFVGRQEQAASQSRQRLEREQLKADIEKVRRTKAALPRAEYTAPEPEDLALRQLRKARGQKYPGGSISFENMPGDTTEVASVTREPFEPRGLPLEQSDLVAVGIIADAKGYVTESKSAAYSEFTVSITEVMKGSVNLTGGQVIAERFGAKIVLPGGRSILVWDANRGTPEAGHRYVLFLKYSSEGQDYFIVTAYDLRGGRVVSIDRWPQCQFFDGNEETAFLDLVRASVKSG